jgi:hypothetical protein
MSCENKPELQRFFEEDEGDMYPEAVEAFEEPVTLERSIMG